MNRYFLMRIAFACAPFIVLFFYSSVAFAQTAKTIGRFTRDGVIASITQGNITVTHDDGQQIDYSTNGLTNGEAGSIIVRGRLPLSFVSPGMLLTASVSLSPMGKVQQSVNAIEFVSDQTQGVELERTDVQGVYRIVGKVIRMTGRGVLLKVPKSPMARQGRVELTTTEETKLVFDMKTLDRVNAGDTVQSMMGVTYEGDFNAISSISIELSPHRKRKVEALSTTDQLLQKYAYLSDDNVSEPRDEKLPNFNLRTDISPLQAKVLGMRLEAMHEVVRRYYKKRPSDRIECKIVADETNWVNETASGSGSRTQSYGGYSSGSMLPVGKVDSSDDHDEVLRAAFDAFCRSTFSSTGPSWYSDGMSLMANYWELGDKSVSVAPEIVAYLKASPPQTLTSVISGSGFSGSRFQSDDDWKSKAASWALCYMMIHNANYSKDFRSLGINMMSGGIETFEERFEDVMREVDFEFRQFQKNFEIGYREDLCEWKWNVTAKKLFGSDMISTDIDARAGWQATKVELVAGQTYKYVAQGEWQTDPEFESSTASGLNGEGRLVGTIFKDYQLSETIRMGDRGKFVAETDGQLYLRCDDRWNQIEDNKGSLKVYVRKAQ